MSIISLRTKMILVGIAAVILTPISLQAVAQQSIPAADQECTNAKDLVKAINGFINASPDLTNQITPEISIRLSAKEGYPEPSGLLYNHETTLIQLDTDENGMLNNLERIASQPQKGRLCLLVDGKTVPDTEENRSNLSISFSFVFKPRDGIYASKDLREGLQDGSKIISSVAPTGLGFLVPGLKTIIIRPKSSDSEEPIVPTVSLLRKSAPITKHLPVRIRNSYFLPVNRLKKSKADTMQVTGVHIVEGMFKVDLKELMAEERKRLSQENK